MNETAIGLIGIFVMLALAAFGLPIAFSMALVGLVGIFVLNGLPSATQIAANVPFNFITDYNFAVFPLFFLMAAIAVRAGLAGNLYALVNVWLGRLPGGLAVAAVGASALFGTICSSTVATALTVGRISLPEMLKRNYGHGLATGALAAGGTLGILIPPSGVLILYGILTQQSIGDLFLAGLLPGVLLGALFAVYIVYVGIRTPEHAPRGPRTNWSQKARALVNAIDVITLMALIILGLLFGWFTAVEAGAVGATGAFIVAAIRGRVTWNMMREAVVETVSGTGMIFVLIAGALVFNTFMALSFVPVSLAALINDAELNPYVIVLLIVLVYLVLGCFIDSLAMILLTIPTFFPIVVANGFDPIWFGIIVVMVTGMGTITPPIGIDVYVIKGIAKDIPVTAIFRGVIPFLLLEVLLTLIVIFVPGVALWIPFLAG